MSIKLLLIDISCSFFFFRQSTPESWAQFSHDNIVRAEHERLASQALRNLIDQILTDTSNDMREQCNTVNAEFTNRIQEMNDAKTAHENHLQKVRKESCTDQ
jgi:tektin-4